MYNLQPQEIQSIYPNGSVLNVTLQVSLCAVWTYENLEKNT